MKSRGSTPVLMVLLGIVTLTSACGKKAVAPAPAPVPDRPTQSSPQDDDARRRAEEEARRRAEEEARMMRAALEEMVFFDYDRSEVRADQRRVLDAKLPILRERSAIRLRIEGHADERGSTEYNLALGMRRAVTVRDYLVDFGLDRGRFETVSFGEERPLSAGHDEGAWSRNRRAAFAVTSGMPITEPAGGEFHP